jgi:hypothetical protein
VCLIEHHERQGLCRRSQREQRQLRDMRRNPQLARREIERGL